MSRSNIEGALDDPRRKFRFMRPYHHERGARIWKYDLHTSDYMRNNVRMTMGSEDGATAMAFWLEALHEHLCTQPHTLAQL